MPSYLLNKTTARRIARAHPEYLAGVEAGLQIMANRIAAGWDYERQEKSAREALATFRAYAREQMAALRDEQGKRL